MLLKVKHFFPFNWFTFALNFTSVDDFGGNQMSDYIVKGREGIQTNKNRECGG